MRPREDRGSTIPLILGFFLIALLMIAGSVAAGDAFVQQSNLQSLCDGAAAAAASSADIDAQRHAGSLQQTVYLQLANVQGAVDAYLSRDSSRSDVQILASLSADRATVTVACSARSSIAFGSFFGFSQGVSHRATSSARARLAVA